MRIRSRGAETLDWAPGLGGVCWLSTTHSSSNHTFRKYNQQQRQQRQQRQPKHLVDAMRERMKQNHENPSMVWESLWQDGITPWDLGGPTPALLAEVQEQQQTHGWRPPTCLIPGCGSGYDVLSLGRFLDSQPTPYKEQEQQGQYTIVGLEVTETPLQRARTIIQDSLDQDGPLSSQTSILLLLGDFFHDPSTWTLYYGTDTQTNSSTTSQQQQQQQQQRSIFPSNQSFSFIFDYTFFCAIPPTQRKLWGKQMERLLTPRGKVLTLMFPYHPLAHETTGTSHFHQGPPYLVSREMYQETLQPRRLVMETPLPYASMATIPQRQGQEVVGWWYKAKL